MKSPREEIEAQVDLSDQMSPDLAKEIGQRRRRIILNVVKALSFGYLSYASVKYLLWPALEQLR